METDVLVLGGGHAGTEAAVLASRRGARVILLTQQLETIGMMSCNPSIGGIAKGTVVREVDALGGVMGRATDRASIQFRMLNASKGPAVASPRSQCDRVLYRSAIRELLEIPWGKHPILLIQGTATRFLFSGDRVIGVLTSDGRRYRAGAVIVTTGTFLRGRIHIGTRMEISAGRAGEPPSVELSEHIAALGLSVGRLKTGTPPRIDGRTIDTRGMTAQGSDSAPYHWSSHERISHPDQRPCWLTWAGEPVKDLIRRHLAESALYGGAISGRGPRYCPSVEDKIVKFPDAPRHQVFLEPEGLGTQELYVAGLSTSLPPEVQVEMLHLVPGLEQAVMTRPGYAIEYDFLPPTQISSTLAVKEIPGLYTAGQINGTTGYEEAAGQGAIAGINAAGEALGLEQVRVRRDQAYLGVMIDDLVSRGVDEPYRLFTSRAEYRLLLRQENALRRMAPLAERLGLWSAAERKQALERLEREDKTHQLACDTAISPVRAASVLVRAGFGQLREPVRISELAKRPGISLGSLFEAAGLEVDHEAALWAGIELQYSGYLSRERELADQFARLEAEELPALDYAELSAISRESREKLKAVMPRTLGQASRVPGVTPADVQVLMLEIRRARSMTH